MLCVRLMHAPHSHLTTVRDMYVKSCLNQFVVYNSLWRLAHVAQLYDLLQGVQQMRTPSPSRGQQQVCHCRLIMEIVVISEKFQCKLSSSNGCPLLMLYLTRLAFGTLHLAHLVELHNLVQPVQIGQQRSAHADGAPSSSSGQQQVCRCNLSMVMSACVLHKLSSSSGCPLLIMCFT